MRPGTSRVERRAIGYEGVDCTALLQHSPVGNVYDWLAVVLEWSSQHGLVRIPSLMPSENWT
ncbi:hypothetical protein PISMIDRAFT_10743 [Pisolithus microcarpus 441]|uniref:Uncharacterized protein n=1 Tax=Pisolithus microcarpus 441 TaxID=765257 RepID=A0A0C9Z3D9_9AGAM|nr:hypothetical protein PISMIDRAFT_10743 [Pisolithus microcarpus 441]